MSWSDCKTSVFNLWYRLHWRILHGSLPIWLQIKWLVQLEPLQLFLWDRDESQIQMAEGEALQWRSPLPEAGSQESGEYVKSPTEISLCLLQFQLGSLGSKLALQLQTRVISWLWLWVSWAILELLEDWGEDAHVTAERDLKHCISYVKTIFISQSTGSSGQIISPGLCVNIRKLRCHGCFKNL